MPSDYRLAPSLAARLLGLSLVGWGLLVFLATVLVVLLQAPVAVLSAAVLVCVAGVFGTGVLLTRAAYVVRLTEAGYRVRFVRGVGVAQGRWSEVEDAATDTIAGSPCVVLRLRDGRTTTIPVEVLAVDREQFVRDLQTHLDRGQRR
ncbi:hypothetical protein [Nocardioides donggukensis]|uniref:PH domain-containing protein n=1 Tax=Nocardioides donggukensis TaxID=2774019 RepID=A0A927K1U4_9ACTN|nr:hypothetical protein [Nocardioides donggukensis]MBD8868117.1 hypothetical protein [Nocardioides donggukensis]